MEEKKPVFKPVIKRRRKSFYETLADQEGDDELDVIPEDEEIVFNAEPLAFVEEILGKLMSDDSEQRTEAAHTIVGLRLEFGKLYLMKPLQPF